MVGLELHLGQASLLGTWSITHSWQIMQVSLGPLPQGTLVAAAYVRGLSHSIALSLINACESAFLLQSILNRDACLPGIYRQTRYQPQEVESCRFGRALRVVVAILFLLQVELEGGRECVSTSKLRDFDFSRHSARDCHTVPQLICRLPAHCTMQS